MAGFQVITEAGKDPYEFYVSRMEHEQVREAIQQLPLDFREVILLREFEELSYQEIATILDCPAGTVMSRLARGRAKLGRCFRVRPRFCQKVGQGMNPCDEHISSRTFSLETRSKGAI
jgi:DNA-directed RNA polymerase specialized sigma24 family protein